MKKSVCPVDAALTNACHAFKQAMRQFAAKMPRRAITEEYLQRHDVVCCKVIDEFIIPLEQGIRMYSRMIKDLKKIRKEFEEGED